MTAVKFRGLFRLAPLLALISREINTPAETCQRFLRGLVEHLLATEDGSCSAPFAIEDSIRSPCVLCILRPEHACSRRLSEFGASANSWRWVSVLSRSRLPRRL